MNKLFCAVLVVMASLAGGVCGQTKAVLKTISTNGLTESVVVPSGISLTVKSGATLTLEDGSTLTLSNQNANLVYAGPTTGSAAAPTFRSLVAGDIPDLSAVYQPVDADLSAIAALITTSHGRGLLTGSSAADTRSTLGLVIGTDVLAPNGSGSSLTALNATQLTSGTVPDARFPATLPAVSGENLTALNGSNISSGTVAPARLGSGSGITTKFLRGDSTWQEVSGGGGGQLAEWAYVDPANGDDTTGDGTAGNPWETLQKAAGTEGRDYIVLAAGNAGPLTLTTTRSISIQGAGRSNSIIGAITVTNGADLNFQDVGMHSFTRGDVNLFGSSEGQNGGDLTVRGSSGGGNFTSFGFNSTTVGLAGASGGTIFISHCEFDSASSNGGSGGAGDSCTTSGEGGSAGHVTVYYSISTAIVASYPGAAGGDGGAGQGAAGTGGNVVSRFSDLQSVGDNGSNDVHASMIGGSWVD